MTQWTANLATGIVLAVGFAWLVSPPVDGARETPPPARDAARDAAGDAAPAARGDRAVSASDGAPDADSGAIRAQSATEPPASLTAPSAGDAPAGEARDAAPPGGEGDALCAGAPLRRVPPPYAGVAPPPEALAITRARFAVEGRAPLAAFRDVDGAWRVGYGRRVEDASVRITEAEAEAFLAEDLRQAAALVGALGAVALHQNEVAALATLAHEIGEDAFRGSIVMAKVNADDRDGALAAWAAREDGGPAFAAVRRRQRALFACDRG